MRLPCLILGLLFCGPSFASESEPTPQAVFEQLKSLAGNWRTTSSNSSTTVSYELIANGTALVESWTMSPTRRSMTVYSMDGDRLIATHYCPWGNAPRLQWARTDERGAHHFAFVDGFNLQDPSGAHQHAFWILLDRSGTLARSETYIGNGAAYDPKRDKGEEDSFTRLK